jgi:hypothetical protein
MKCLTKLTHEDDYVLGHNDVQSGRRSPVFQRNVGYLLPDYMALYPKRDYFAESLLWEPKIPNTDKYFEYFLLIQFWSNNKTLQKLVWCQINEFLWPWKKATYVDTKKAMRKPMGVV